MSTNKPETPAKKPEEPPSIQMTPVGFSPVSSEDAIGVVQPKIALRDIQFPMAIPVTIVLLTLIFSAMRDISGFNRRLSDIDRQDAPSVEKLKRVPKQSEFIESLRKSLVKIAPTDPDANLLLRQYFPSPKQDKDKDKDSQAAPAPAK